MAERQQSVPSRGGIARGGWSARALKLSPRPLLIFLPTLKPAHVPNILSSKCAISLQRITSPRPPSCPKPVSQVSAVLCSLLLAVKEDELQSPFLLVSQGGERNRPSPTVTQARTEGTLPDSAVVCGPIKYRQSDTPCFPED